MFYQYEHHQKLNFRPQLTLFSVSFQSYMLDGGKGGSSGSGSPDSSAYSGKLHVRGITSKRGRGAGTGEGDRKGNVGSCMRSERDGDAVMREREEGICAMV